MRASVREERGDHQVRDRSGGDFGLWDDGDKVLRLELLRKCERVGRHTGQSDASRRSAPRRRLLTIELSNDPPLLHTHLSCMHAATHATRACTSVRVPVRTNT